MANPPCMSGDGNPASMVATMLSTGDGFALCDECIVPWAAGLLNVMTGVDPTPFLEAVSEPDAASDGDVEGGAATPTTAEAEVVDPPRGSGRRGRTSAASPEAGTETDPGADGQATPATDVTPAA